MSRNLSSRMMDVQNSDTNDLRTPWGILFHYCINPATVSQINERPLQAGIDVLTASSSWRIDGAGTSMLLGFSLCGDHEPDILGSRAWV